MSVIIMAVLLDKAVQVLWQGLRVTNKHDGVSYQFNQMTILSETISLQIT